MPSDASRATSPMGMTRPEIVGWLRFRGYEVCVDARPSDDLWIQARDPAAPRSSDNVWPLACTVGNSRAFMEETFPVLPDSSAARAERRRAALPGGRYDAAYAEFLVRFNERMERAFIQGEAVPRFPNPPSPLEFRRGIRSRVVDPGGPSARTSEEARRTAESLRGMLA